MFNPHLILGYALCVCSQMDINLNQSFEKYVGVNNSVMEEVVGNKLTIVEVDLNKTPMEEVVVGPDENPSLLIYEIEEKLEVGSVVESLEQAYILYYEYGRYMRFSLKRGSRDYFSHTNELNTKLYCCSCEGLPVNF